MVETSINFPTCLHKKMVAKRVLRGDCFLDGGGGMIMAEKAEWRKKTRT